MKHFNRNVLAGFIFVLTAAVMFFVYDELALGITFGALAVLTFALGIRNSREETID
jgi:hypothetical protein